MPSLPIIQIWLRAPDDGHAACDVAGDVFHTESVLRFFHVAVVGGEQRVIGGRPFEDDRF